MITSKGGKISVFTTEDHIIGKGINIIHTGIGFFCDRGIYLFPSEGKTFSAKYLVMVSPCIIPLTRQEFVIKTYSEEEVLVPFGAEIAVVFPSIIGGMGAIDLVKSEKELWGDVN